MAEVGQRLGTGAYRLTALRKSQSRPVVIGESPAPLLVSCTFNGSRKKEDSTQGRREVSNRRATQCKLEKVPRVRSGESQQENWNLRCTSSVMLESSRCIDFVHIRGSIQSNITTLYLSRLQPLQQGKLLQARMTSWTSRAASIYPDNLRFPQQHRAFCTLILILTEQGSERSGGGLKRLKRLKLHPDAPQASTARRSYSWRSGSGSEKVPPLFRSRTAYYDILKVSSSATQSQIKTAYYKQSFIYHPDKNPGSDEATQLFSEISEAYTVLGSISLRRKYDHGILSQSDIQSAGRPSSKETSSRSTGNPQQQQHQQRARRFSQAGGKTMFDFDAFYKAHYGEQLQRERDTRARKQYVEEQKKKTHQKWKEAKMMEVTVAMLMALAGIILISLHEP